MTSFFLLVALLGPAHAEEEERAEDAPPTCRPLAFLANDIDEQVSNFYLADAEATLEQLDWSLACSGPAERPVLARVFNALGTLQLLKQDRDEATRFYVAAKRLDAEVWNPFFGPVAKGVWEAAEPTEVSGSIAFRPAPGKRVWWVDGVEAAPLEQPAGWHVVQVQSATDADTLSVAGLVDVPPGGEAVMKLDQATLAPGSVVVQGRSRIPVFAVAGGGLLLASGVVAGLRGQAVENGIRERLLAKQSRVEDELDAQKGANTLYTAEYILLGTGALLVGGGIALELRGSSVSAGVQGSW